MQSSFVISILLASLGSLLFAAKAIVAKFSYQYGATADVVLTLRMVFALPIFWIAVWWHYYKKAPAPLARPDVVKVFSIGILGYFLSSYLDFLGLHYISVGLERVILYLTPALVLLLSKFLLKKHIDPRQYWAMVVAYLGIVMVLFHDLKMNDDGAIVLGSTLVLLAAIVYSVYLIYAGELVGRVGSIRMVALASTSATVTTCIQSLMIDVNHLWVQATEVYYLAMINALFCTFMPMLFVMIAVNRIGSSLTAQAGTIGPVGTAFLGWYFLSEPVSMLQFTGIAIVLIAIAILLSIGNKHNQTSASSD